MSDIKAITWNIDGKESAPMFFSNPVEDLKAIAQVEALSEIQREVLKACADLLASYRKQLDGVAARMNREDAASLRLRARALGLIEALVKPFAPPLPKGIAGKIMALQKAVDDCDRARGVRS